ncbi:hypothetical protein, partial [Ursidibacter sp. B-7004-1]
HNATIKDLNVTNKTKTKDLEVTGNSTLGNTTIGGEGKTFNVTNGTKIDMGGNTINNITSGEIKEGNTQAVTGGAVHTKVKELIDGGIKFMGNNGTVITTKLGKQLNIIGGNVTQGNYSSNNVRTQADGTGNITIEFAEKPKFEAVEAKDLNVTGNA